VPPDPRPRLREVLSPVDRIHAGFYAFVLAVCLLRLGSLTHPERAVGWYAGALAATLLLARALARRAGWAGTWPRVAFTLAVAPVTFLMLAFVVPDANPFHQERLLHAIDTWMFFGRNPNVLLDGIATPWLTEILQFVYATYYVIPVVLGACLYAGGNRDGFGRSLFLVVLCLYASYVGYFLLPATGPNINRLGLYPAHFSEPMEGLWIAEALRKSTFEAEWIKQDCWPSGHTALAVVCLVLAHRERSRSGIVLLWFPVVALVFSTMYLRYHYLIDVIFGLVLAWATLKFGPRLYVRWRRPAFDPPPLPPPPPVPGTAGA
jgi:membrane-associated phospholipid phosphatase